MSKTPLHIDVFFDFICPWCLIGKRQLDAAIGMLKQSHPQVEVVTHWRGVQLLSHLPEQGVDFESFYLQRLGSAQAVEMRQAQVRAAALAVGVEIDFKKIKTMPNTAKAHHFMNHVMMTLGPTMQVQALLERLFSAYFFLQEDIGDEQQLNKIAEQCGLTAYFTDDATQAVPAEPFFQNSGPQVRKLSSAYERSLQQRPQMPMNQGVPYFIFDARLGVSGAQPAQVLYRSMLDALK